MHLYNLIYLSLIGVLKTFLEYEIFQNGVSLTEWLATQGSGVINLIDSDTAVQEKPLTFYNFMIKTTVKPQLDMNAVNVYNSLQTIAYHPKEINAIFCPISKEIKKRLLSILDPKYLLL